MRERGLRTDRSTLVVLDGSKALTKAVREVFGARALIQRCQAHKARNIVDHLPEDMRPSVREAIRPAYGAGDAARAKRLLGNLARRLRDDHPSAAESVEEDLDETVTVMRLGLPRSLQRVLSTTNAIENLIGSVRSLGRRVKRWRDGRMISAGLSLPWPTPPPASGALPTAALGCSSSSPSGVSTLVREALNPAPSWHSN